MKFENDKHSNAPVDTEDLLTDLKRVSKEEQKVSQSIYAEKGRYDCSTIIRRFGIWNKALKKAGITLANEINISEERLYENLLNLWQWLGRQPRRSDLMSKYSEFSQSPYNRRFKTRSNALLSKLAVIASPQGRMFFLKYFRGKHYVLTSSKRLIKESECEAI